MTILAVAIWFLTSLIVDELCLREKTLINTNAIIYNKNNDSYVYMTKDVDVYKLIQDDEPGDISSYGKLETEIVFSNENILETYTTTPVNKKLEVLFNLSDKTKYVIKTNEVKMILQ